MRKSFRLFSIILVAGLFSVTACSENKTYTSYQCPMKCEGKKTYDKAGNCPVCEMELEGVASSN
jgi:protein SCO1/2